MCNVSILQQVFFTSIYTKRYLSLYFIIVQQVEGLSGGEEGGTYYVDQSGQYYYQANNDEPPVMTQVQIQEVEETDVQNEGEATQDEQYHEIEELENAEGDEDVSNIKIPMVIILLSNIFYIQE